MSANQDDDALLATLTPEELAAMAETDPEEQAALAAVAAGATDPASGAAPVEGKSSAEPAATPPAAAPAVVPAPAPATPTEPERATAAPQPAYRAELPADHADKKAETEQAMADLRAKFKAGDIELDAYEAERDRLASEAEALRRAELKAEIAQEMTAQSAEVQWANAIRAQFNAAKQSGVDYDTDEAKRSDLDTFVRALAAKDENSDKSMDWFLAEAHKRVLALHDIKPSAATAPAPAPKPAATREAPVAAVVPSMANVPGSSEAVGSDEFAELDRLDGLELEAALSRLTQAQREKYMQGA